MGQSRILELSEKEELDESLYLVTEKALSPEGYSTREVAIFDVRKHLLGLRATWPTKKCHRCPVCRIPFKPGMKVVLSDGRAAIVGEFDSEVYLALHQGCRSGPVGEYRPGFASLRGRDHA